MKTKLLLFFSLLITISSIAQNLIAVQNGGTPSFYENANDAFDNAMTGDTLYFPGGSYNINKTIDKKLHIVGTGHNPTSTTATGQTIFASGDGTHQLIYTTGGGGSITGIAFTNANASGNIMVNANIDGLIIDRVNLYTGFHCNLGTVRNFLLVRSVVEYIDIREKNNELPSGLIANNLILEEGNYTDNLKIEHNNFLRLTGNGNPNNPPLIANNCNVVNNIFSRYATTSISSNSYNCSFRNNHGYTSSGVSANGNFGSNGIFVNNLFNLFINYGSNTSPSVTYIYDFHLTTNSPLLTASNSGGQIGIYGGRYPWVDGSIPFNPHIISKNISGTTDQNGNIPVEIEVQSQQN